MVLDDGVMCVADLLDDGIEAVDFVRCVVNDAFGAIRLDQRVRSFDFISVARFPRLFVVAGVQVLHGIAKFVVGWCLEVCDSVSETTWGGNVTGRLLRDNHSGRHGHRSRHCMRRVRATHGQRANNWSNARKSQTHRTTSPLGRM